MPKLKRSPTALLCITMLIFLTAAISSNGQDQHHANLRAKISQNAPKALDLRPSVAEAQSGSLCNDCSVHNQANHDIGHVPTASNAISQKLLPDSNALAPLWDAYNAAVQHVSVWRNEDVRPLKPIAVDLDGTVEVVTATRYDLTSPLYGDTWVTIVPEVQAKCQHFTGDVAMQLRELLGLPPDHQIPHIFVMRVKASDIFRPTPDPNPWTLCPCGNSINQACRFALEVECGNRFPKDVAVTHQQWIANTTMSLRRIPNGFPWTHLGYTYNWAPGQDHYGASEYIVRKGAEVKITGKVSPEEYCKVTRAVYRRPVRHVRVELRSLRRHKRRTHQARISAQHYGESGERELAQGCAFAIPNYVQIAARITRRQV